MIKVSGNDRDNFMPRCTFTYPGRDWKMTRLLSGQRVLVVGGRSGIGLAVAKQAHNQGARVVVASRSAAERRQALADLIAPGIEAHSLDVTSDTQVEAALRAIGRIDHLVFTARPEIQSKPFLEIDPEQAKSACDTKFWGQYRVIRHALRFLREDGSIVLTSGIAGDKVFRNSSTMAIINGATEALCKSLAVELAPVRVNAVSPGFVEPKTPSIVEYAKRFPSGRLASEDEIANAYIHLLEATYMMGVTMVVDGGARLI